MTKNIKVSLAVGSTESAPRVKPLITNLHKDSKLQSLDQILVFSRPAANKIGSIPVSVKRNFCLKGQIPSDWEYQN